jgi:hypothetical protein
MQEKYYSELNDIPLYNFEKCINGDYRFVCKQIPEKWGIDEVQAFSDLYEAYVQKYQREKLVSQITLYKSIIELQCMYIETGDAYFLTQIEIKKASIPKIEDKQENTTKILIQLSRFQGHRLNPREITVDEFYSIIEDYERSNKSK